MNRVMLRGRLAATPEVREHPDGKPYLTARLIVDREPPLPGERRDPAGPTVDTFDLVAEVHGTRAALQILDAGDEIAVEGTLRRRFYRAGTGAASRVEVLLSGQPTRLSTRADRAADANRVLAAAVLGAGPSAAEPCGDCVRYPHGVCRFCGTADVPVPAGSA